MNIDIEKWIDELESRLIPFDFDEVIKGVLRKVERLIEEGDSSTASYHVDKLCRIRASLAWDKDDFVFFFSENRICLDKLVYIKSIKGDDEKQERLMYKYVQEPFVFEHNGVEYEAIIP